MVRARGDETVSSSHRRTDAHMNSQRLYQHCIGTAAYWVATILRRVNENRFISTMKNLFIIDTYL